MICSFRNNGSQISLIYADEKMVVSQNSLNKKYSFSQILRIYADEKMVVLQMLADPSMVVSQMSQIYADLSSSNIYI